jgi:LacI family transcriptional regulator
VGLNNFESAFNATEHLWQQGYREIGFITINSLQSQMLQRLQGYEKAIDKYKGRHYIKEIAYYLEPQNMTEHIIEFLKRRTKLDALFFATNYLGVCGLKAIKQLGYSIPDDLGIVSFDDLLLFELYSPGITAIAQPVEAMSEQLINILLEKLIYKKQTKRELILPGTLIKRGSSAKKAK